MRGKFLLPLIVECIGVSRFSLGKVTEMAGWAVVALLCVFLPVCTGHDLFCKVTCDGDQVIYSVSSVTENMTLHSYSWANNNTVFATNKGKIDPVKSGTADTLIASKCIPDIVLQKEYLKDGTVHDFTANCNINCEAVNLIQVQDEPSYSWTEVVGILVGVGVCVGVIAVLIRLGFKYRKISSDRTCCCSQTGGFFNPVKVIIEAPREEVMLTNMPSSRAS